MYSIQGLCLSCTTQLLIKAGTEGRQTVFLFADSQIKDESFMEDISMILNTGDVPNLYAADEKAEIIEKMQIVARNEVCLCLCVCMLVYACACACMHAEMPTLWQ